MDTKNWTLSIRKTYRCGGSTGVCYSLNGQNGATLITAEMAEKMALTNHDATKINLLADALGLRTPTNDKSAEDVALDVVRALSDMADPTSPCGELRLNAHPRGDVWFVGVKSMRSRGKKLDLGYIICRADGTADLRIGRQPYAFEKHLTAKEITCV